jgi:hypothetical protein
MTDVTSDEQIEAVDTASSPAMTPPSDVEVARQLMDRARSEGVSLVGPGGLLSRLTKTVLEAALEAEMTEHVGYEPHDRAGHHSANSRNGTRTKTVTTDIGPVEVEVPRDRNGTFDPKMVRKRQRRLTGVDHLVVSLVAKGLTTGEVQAHLGEVYGADVSGDTISRITDRVVETMVEWQHRPLDRGRFLAVVANHGMGGARRKSVRTSCGVRSPSTSRGRSLSSAATRSRSARLCTARLVRFGKYWRSSPLVFSLVGRCHGDRGSQKKMRVPQPASICSCSVSSRP